MAKAAFLLCLSVAILAPAFARSVVTEDPDRMSILLLPRDFGGPAHVRARDFLWQHWRQKRPGLLEVASCTREGVRHEWRYEVVIQENGSAVIAATGHTVNNGSCPIAGLAVPAGTTLSDIPREPESFESMKISTVERIRRVGKSDNVTTLPPEKRLSATKYSLRFRDEKNEILGTF